MNVRGQIAITELMALVLVVILAGPTVPSMAAASPSAAKDVITMKLGTKMPSESLEGRAFQKFADLAAQKSGGRIRIDVYPVEQLGTGTTQIDNIILGTQDMYVDGSTYLDRFDKDFRICSVPYLFQTQQQFQNFVTGPVGKEMEKTLIGKGLRILNDRRNFVRGPYRVIAAKKPIQGLDDVKGLRFRSYESEVYSKAWKYLGANPIVIALSETYLALKQNLVEAVTIPVTSVYDMKFYEVAPHITRTNEYPQDVVITINEKRYQSLGPDLQKVLREAAFEAGEQATQMTYESVDRDSEKVKKGGGKYYEINLKPFADKMEPYHKELESKGFISRGIVDKIRATPTK